jgi:glutamate synthase (NADPH/NADH) large chain
MLFDYFTQKFAQVTNPPLDWEREEIVTCLESAIGPEPNLLDDTELHAKQDPHPRWPVVNSDEMAQLKRLDQGEAYSADYYRPYIVKGLYQVAGGGKALEERLEEIFGEVDAGHRRRQATSSCSPTGIPTIRGAPIPSLAAHQRGAAPPAQRTHTRTQISMAVEAGDVREIHHVALLIAYGAACVNPYLAFESVEDLARNTGYLVRRRPRPAMTEPLRKALSTGVLKIMSKMGVSTIMSYRGAQLFEAVGPEPADVVDKVLHRHHLARRAAKGLDEMAEEVADASPGGLSEPMDGDVRTASCAPAATTNGGAPARTISTIPEADLPAAAVDAAAPTTAMFKQLFGAYQRHFQPAS